MRKEKWNIWWRTKLFYSLFIRLLLNWLIYIILLVFDDTLIIYFMVRRRPMKFLRNVFPLFLLCKSPTSHTNPTVTNKPPVYYVNGRTTTESLHLFTSYICLPGSRGKENTWHTGTKLFRCQHRDLRENDFRKMEQSDRFTDFNFWLSQWTLEMIVRAETR